MEGKIVQDADRLDAIGAVGIARTFAYAGNKNLPLYSGSDNTASKKIGKGSGISHFYQKLLNLKDLINTEKAKGMANKRHQFMLDFLAEFHEETGEMKDE